MYLIDSKFVYENLAYKDCMEAVREAMIAFSAGRTRQHLRSILDLGDGALFGIMPGGMDEAGVFGAKLVSVFPGNFELGKSSHQGVVVLFESEGGAPVCVVDAGAVTAIRTAAASAAATDVLARPEASTLALMGYGEQAYTHARAMCEVRDLKEVRIWGRSADRAAALARRLEAELNLKAHAVSSAEAAAAGADIICTVTSAQDPVLERRWVSPGTHVNAVGSSFAGPAEIDNELVKDARFIADSREGVASQGGEFLRAKAAGLVDDSHIAAEIGDVFSGEAEGRRSAEEITVYKSLGHIVQDLIAAALLMKSMDKAGTDEKRAVAGTV
ncbi:ornithine cyclodeaminase family protein [Hyphococcus luteus]|uniref:Ornithine cyclodeaminase n=1 Tax=Hyphococcus luteus TaxID=2058213 RepID=A0A2S7K0E9_9PROT|nr:ornithine cyclodeaminase family protein [Marinicaulis flavus]PQA85995.1 ornithine cyclodeaminase [Marinicaulis flavus]